MSPSRQAGARCSAIARANPSWCSRYRTDATTAMTALDRAQFDDLSAPILSDVMDGLGMPGQAMRPFVRPLDESAVLVGRARTGLYMPVYEARPGDNPYEVE